MQFRVVWDQTEACPYLPDRLARLPLKTPVTVLSREEFDQLLDEGERRSGRMMYRTQCAGCRACEPLRVPTARFRATPSQRRVWRKNDGVVRIEIGRPQVTPDRVRLYNRHKLERGLARSEEPLSASTYAAWLVDTCVNTREIRYFVEDRLIAISILDFGRTSASSVYHYFDPDESDRSLGVYSVLKEIELCASLGITWYYLGFYVEGCGKLEYKANYWPHERRIDGEWREIVRATGGEADRAAPGGALAGERPMAERPVAERPVGERPAGERASGEAGQSPSGG
jgi:arginine-tRNA-protein transferase